jgi:DNA-binding transcriptional MerR regulator/methylmalonyl-CoA mutase cobalamin-binding subunit
VDLPAVNDRFSSRPLALSIAAVERDTGLSKDTLRVWERRYRFPQPERDALGERIYPIDQVEKLRILKRLLDAGHRPGRIVPMPVEHLQQLCESTIDHDAPSPGALAWTAQDLRPYVDLLRTHDVAGLRRQLGQAVARLGLSRFVGDVVVPLNALVGDAWMRGQMEVFEEHMYTESVQVVLRHGLASMPEADADARPCVLLTTFPGEPHGLGLLMAEAVLAVEGCRCVSLGVQTPVWDIVLAAQAYEADIVALGFTGSVNPNHVVDGLSELRAKLPARVALWAGGTAPVLHRRAPDGVVALATLEAIGSALQGWRQSRH